MKTAIELMRTMGKKKFVDFATHSQKGETMGEREKRTRWGKGRVLSSICSHGKLTVRDGEYVGGCVTCETSSNVSKARDFEPHFNMGLGAWIESKSEMIAEAKRQGMTWIGDDK